MKIRCLGILTGMFQASPRSLDRASGIRDGVTLSVCHIPQQSKSYAKRAALLGVLQSVVWRAVYSGAEAPLPDPVSDEWAKVR